MYHSVCVYVTRFGFALAATKPHNATTHQCNNANERSETTNRDTLRYLGHLLGMPIKSAITVGKKSIDEGCLTGVAAVMAAVVAVATATGMMTTATGSAAGVVASAVVATAVVVVVTEAKEAMEAAVVIMTNRT